jgi:hypothetical protein
VLANDRKWLARYSTIIFWNWIVRADVDQSPLAGARHRGASVVPRSPASLTSAACRSGSGVVLLNDWTRAILILWLTTGLVFLFLGVASCFLASSFEA